MTVTAGLGQYLENALCNWFRGVTFPAVPSMLYLALFTTPPVNGSDAAAVEVVGGSYARQGFAPALAAWTAPTGAAPATILLGANQVFPTPSSPWGTVTGWAIYDSAGPGGNLLMYGTFDAVQPTTGDAVEFLSGQLALTVT